MALPFYIKQTTITEMDGMILKIAILRTQLTTETQSDTTDSLRQLLHLYEKTLVNLRNTYNSLSKGGMEYTRKLANFTPKAPVTGVQNALKFLENNEQVNNTDSPDRNSDTAKQDAIKYTIQPGDTLSEISEKSGVSVEELCRVNNIVNPNLIRAGASLIIPLSMSLPTLFGNLIGVEKVDIKINKAPNDGKKSKSSATSANQTRSSVTSTNQPQNSVSSTNQATTSSQTDASNNVNSQNSVSQSVLNDQEKMQKALRIKYENQNASSAAKIDYTAKNGPKKTAKQSACGAFSVLHSLRYLGKDKGISLETICKIAVQSGARYNGGTHIQELVTELKNRGYDVTCDKYLRPPTTNEINSIGNGNVMVCSMDNNKLYGAQVPDDSTHFVSIVEISNDKSKVLVIDSLQGGMGRGSNWDGKGSYGDTAVDGRYWMPVSELKRANSTYLIH